MWPTQIGSILQQRDAIRIDILPRLGLGQRDGGVSARWSFIFGTGSTPSEVGAYLTGCMLYARIATKDPRGELRARCKISRSRVALLAGPPFGGMSLRR